MNRAEERTTELLNEGLPEGWALAQLGELGEWGSGGTPSKSRGEFWEAGTVPWVTPKDMKRQVIGDSLDHITEDAVSATGLTLLPVGSLLFVVRGMILARAFPVARCAKPVTINQDLRSLIPHESISPAFLACALRQQEIPVLHAVKEATHGTLRLDSDDLRAWPIPLAPLAECGPTTHRLLFPDNASLSFQRREPTTHRGDSCRFRLLVGQHGPAPAADAAVAPSAGNAPGRRPGALNSRPFPR
jgi:hypothetical protein